MQTLNSHRSSSSLNWQEQQNDSAMSTLLRMLEESQGKLEQQMRENAELRLNLKELEMIDRNQVPMG